MGSLVKDFQRDLVQSSKSTVELLRTAKLISVKLGLDEITEWINSELNGKMLLTCSNVFMRSRGLQNRPAPAPEARQKAAHGETVGWLAKRNSKRQGAGALQDASRGSVVIEKRASVLDCGGPPPLFHCDAARCG
jgi:hypothetical protein